MRKQWVFFKKRLIFLILAKFRADFALKQQVQSIWNFHQFPTIFSHYRHRSSRLRPGRSRCSSCSSNTSRSRSSRCCPSCGRPHCTKSRRSKSPSPSRRSNVRTARRPNRNPSKNEPHATTYLATIEGLSKHGRQSNNFQRNRYDQYHGAQEQIQGGFLNISD